MTADKNTSQPIPRVDVEPEQLRHGLYVRCMKGVLGNHGCVVDPAPERRQFLRYQPRLSEHIAIRRVALDDDAGQTITVQGSVANFSLTTGVSCVTAILPESSSCSRVAISTSQ